MHNGMLGAVGTALVGIGLLGLTATPLFAQEAPTAPTHAQMDQMMVAMHGQDGARAMHAMMGGGDAARGEQIMDRCVGMMGMMQGMSGTSVTPGMQPQQPARQTPG